MHARKTDPVCHSERMRGISFPKRSFATLRMTIRLVLIAFIVIFTTTSSAYAEKRVSAGVSGNDQKCKMVTTAQVGVNFNNVESNVSTVKSSMDQKIAAITALAKEAGINTVELQSSNYSAYANNNSGGCPSPENMQIQISGNASFDVKPPEKAGDFMNLLIAKGYMANFNVNSYKQCE